ESGTRGRCPRVPVVPSPLDVGSRFLPPGLLTVALLLLHEEQHACDGGEQRGENTLLAPLLALFFGHKAPLTWSPGTPAQSYFVALHQFNTQTGSTHNRMGSGPGWT